MKPEVVILAGGRAERFGPMIQGMPKPMLRIGDRPTLDHVMRIYASYGFDAFTVLLGYKGGTILDYFAEARKEWKIDFEFTGLYSDTAERLLKVKDKLKHTFFLSYADVLANVNLARELRLHKRMGRIGTMTVVPLNLHYGVTELKGSEIARYVEKPSRRDIWINGGFMVFEPGVFGYFKSGDKDFSKTVLPRLAEDGELSAFKHDDFWVGMDTFKEYAMLNELWDRGEARWAVRRQGKSAARKRKA